MLGITYDMALSAVFVVYYLAFSAHGKQASRAHRVYIIIQHRLGCHSGNKGSEALMNAGFRSPLSDGIGILMYS